MSLAVPKALSPNYLLPSLLSSVDWLELLPLLFVVLLVFPTLFPFLAPSFMNIFLALPKMNPDPRII